MLWAVPPCSLVEQWLFALTVSSLSLVFISVSVVTAFSVGFQINSFLYRHCLIDAVSISLYPSDHNKYSHWVFVLFDWLFGWFGLVWFGIGAFCLVLAFFEKESLLRSSVLALTTRKVNRTVMSHEVWLICVMRALFTSLCVWLFFMMIRLGRVVPVVGFPSVGLWPCPLTACLPLDPDCVVFVF